MLMVKQDLQQICQGRLMVQQEIQCGGVQVLQKMRFQEWIDFLPPHLRTRSPCIECRVLAFTASAVALSGRGFLCDHSNTGLL